MMIRYTHWISRSFRLVLKACLIFTAFLIFTGVETFAQKPVVAAVVWDDRAKEGEDLGELRIYQLGEPVPGLKVKVRYEGTAKNGFDYRCFSDELEIDRYGKFVVRPILDAGTVFIQLENTYNLPDHLT